MTSNHDHGFIGWTITAMGGVVGWLMDPTHIIQALTIVALLIQIVIHGPKAWCRVRSLVRKE